MPLDARTKAAPEYADLMEKIRFLFSRNWRRMAVCGGVLGLFVVAIHAVSIPRFLLSAEMEIEPIRPTEKEASQAVLLGEAASARAKVEEALSVLKSESFFEILASKLKQVDPKRVMLVWGVGPRLRLQFLSWRMGFSPPVEVPRLNPSKATEKDIAFVLGQMLRAVPDYKNRIVRLDITSYQRETATTIMELVVDAFEEARVRMQAANSVRMQALIAGRLENAQRELIEKEARLLDFLKEKPWAARAVTADLSASGLSNSIVAETGTVVRELEVQKSLIRKYEGALSRSVSGRGGAESDFEIRNQVLNMKKEREALLARGYSATHPRLLEIQANVERLQAFLKNRRPASKDEFAQLPHVEIQRLLQEARQREHLLIAQLESLRKPQSHDGLSLETMMADEVTAQSLFREVKYAEAKLSEYQMALRSVEQRAFLQEAIVRRLQAYGSTVPRRLGLPPRLKIPFAAIVGCVLFVMGLVLKETFNPTLVTKRDVESLGFRFAGHLGADTEASAFVAHRLGIGQPSAKGETAARLLVTAPTGPVPEGLESLFAFLAKGRKLSVAHFVLHPDIPSTYRWRWYDHGDSGIGDAIECDSADIGRWIAEKMADHGRKNDLIVLWNHRGIREPGFEILQPWADEILVVIRRGMTSVSSLEALFHAVPDKSRVFIAYREVPASARTVFGKPEVKRAAA